MKAFTVSVIAAVSAAGFGQSFFDNFNRADAADLGANWESKAGSPTRIIGNEAGNVAQQVNLSLVRDTTFTAQYDQVVVSADFRLTDESNEVSYVALALGQDGNLTPGHGLYVKIQRQSTSLSGLSYAGFYTAGGDDSSLITGGTRFFSMESEVRAGRMSIWCSTPTTINLGIDTDFNGSFELTYARTLDFDNGFVVGNQVGIGVYSEFARMDNYSVTPVPEPVSLTALGIGALLLMRRRRNA